MSTKINDTLNVVRNFPKFDFTAPFWEATRSKRLKIQYAPGSDSYQYPPRNIDMLSGSLDLEWREVSGKGIVKTYTVITKGIGAFSEATPYVIVSVTLPEGVDIISNLVHCDLEDVEIGMEVEPYWLPMADGDHLLMFQPCRR